MLQPVNTPQTPLHFVKSASSSSKMTKSCDLTMLALRSYTDQEQLKAALQDMRTFTLIQRANEAGVDRKRVENAVDGGEPREELIALLLEATNATS